MIRILAYVTAGREFDIAHEINEMGAMATAPRALTQTRDKTRKHVWTETPALQNYIFCAMTENQWHWVSAGILIKGHRIKPRIVTHVNPMDWADMQKFAVRMEMEFTVATDAAERAATKGQRYVCPYKTGDHIQLLGDSLRGHMARFSRVVRDGGEDVVEAEMTIMGRAVKVKARPGDVAAWPLANNAALG